MARTYTFPRTSRGSKIFRVEWKKDNPWIAEYTVQTAATSSVVVHDASGKEQILMGKETLRQFASTPEEAVCREFQRIANKVSRHGADAKAAVLQAAKLGPLLK